jgi:FkbM family methyltransferase
MKMMDIYRSLRDEVSIWNAIKLVSIAIFPKKGKIFQIHLKKDPCVVFVRARTTDCFLVYSILVNRGGEYPAFANYNPQCIIDAGANIGLATLFFKRHYPDALIIAIEPDVDNCKMFRLNTSKLNHVRLLQAGVGPESGKFLRIKNGQDKSYSFILEEALEGDVPELSVKDICTQFKCQKIDIFKIDIEGGEKELFSRNTDWIQMTDNIFIETHDHLNLGCSQKLLEQVKGDFHLRTRGENLIFTRQYLGIIN